MVLVYSTFSSLLRLMNIICWNCRGAGGKGFPTLIRDLRRNYEAHLIILLETHISGDRGKIIRNKIGFDSCCVEEARGHSGGIWVLWDSHYWKVEAIQQHIQFIHLKIEGRDSMPWMLTAIYGSPQRLMRKSLWDNLRDLRNSVNLPWCTIGDFNAILHSYKKGEELLLKVVMLAPILYLASRM
ncbi:hypothetical protein AAHE18_03G083600 [Arachis hypogaea]